MNMLFFRRQVHSRSQIIFADEDTLYIWGIDETESQPWRRLTPYLIDESHNSWTIFESHVVADIDGDGKAELLVLNAPKPDHMDEY